MRGICMAAVGALALLPAAARCAELAATYFTVAAYGDPDFGGFCCRIVTDLVQPMLGPGGAPLLNPAYRAGGGRSYVVHDVDGNGEITWWTPGPTVTRTGTGTVALPIDTRRLFPPNGTGATNAFGYQTAVFRGVLHVPVAERVRFRVGADDAAFLYINGVLVADLGGIHERINLPAVTETLAAGDYCLTLFYADLFPYQAELFLAIETPDVTIAPPSEAAPLQTTAGGCAVPVS
jgi:hypothetical protein